MSFPRRRLLTSVPAAGFLWETGVSVLRRPRRDELVVAALRDLGGCPNLTTGQIDAALANLFLEATSRAEAGGLRDAATTAHFIAGLRAADALPWAGRLSEGVLIDLFTTVRDARRAWHQKPRAPYNTNEHGRLAHAVEAFDAAAHSQWAAVDIELFWLAGGGDEDEDEGEAMETGDEPAAAPLTQSQGAHAAGEPATTNTTAIATTGSGAAGGEGSSSAAAAATPPKPSEEERARQENLIRRLLQNRERDMMTRRMAGLEVVEEEDEDEEDEDGDIEMVM